MTGHAIDKTMTVTRMTIPPITPHIARKNTSSSWDMLCFEGDRDRGQQARKRTGGIACRRMDPKSCVCGMAKGCSLHFLISSLCFSSFPFRGTISPHGSSSFPLSLSSFPLFLLFISFLLSSSSKDYLSFVDLPFIWGNRKELLCLLVLVRVCLCLLVLDI